MKPQRRKSSEANHPSSASKTARICPLRIVCRGSHGVLEPGSPTLVAWSKDLRYQVVLGTEVVIRGSLRDPRDLRSVERQIAPSLTRTERLGRRAGVMIIGAQRALFVSATAVLAIAAHALQPTLRWGVRGSRWDRQARSELDRKAKNLALSATNDLDEARLDVIGGVPSTPSSVLRRRDREVWGPCPGRHEHTACSRSGPRRSRAACGSPSRTA